MSHKLTDNYKKKIIWVNPFLLKLFSAPPNWWWYARIEKRLKNKIAKKMLEKIAMGKLFYGGDWDLTATLFNESDWIKNIRSLRLNYKNYKNCSWYKLIKSEIYSNGFFKYKNKIIKNDEDLKFFFENYLEEMITSLKMNGFIVSDNHSEDIPKALIGRNGDLIKTGNGCHRLAIIQEFEIKCNYPIQIVGIHKELKINGVKVGFSQLMNLDKFINNKFSGDINQ